MTTKRFFFGQLNIVKNTPKWCTTVQHHTSCAMRRTTTYTHQVRNHKKGKERKKQACTRPRKCLPVYNTNLQSSIKQQRRIATAYFRHMLFCTKNRRNNMPTPTQVRHNTRIRSMKNVQPTWQSVCPTEIN